MYFLAIHINDQIYKKNKYSERFQFYDKKNMNLPNDSFVKLFYNEKNWWEILLWNLSNRQNFLSSKSLICDLLTLIKL